MRHHRRGTVLIIVSAIAALLVSLSLTFLVRVRNDVEEGELQARLAQARVMLVAACQYIQESSRIGWDTGTGSEHAETFGWIDVRDGSLGPRTTSVANPGTPTGNKPIDPLDSDSGSNRFPIGKPQRFDLYVPQRPPYALSLRATYNAVDTAAPDSGRAYLRYPDPQPALGLNHWAGTTATPGTGVTATDYNDWAKGERLTTAANAELTPRLQTVGRCWFRIVREASGAIFTITCGAGGSHGFRTWKEVSDAGSEALFGGDPLLFATLSANELRLFYRIEWSPATTVIDMNFLREHEEHSFRVGTPTYVGGNPDNNYSGQQMAPNMGGTIQWIQRLRQEPPLW